MSRQLSALQHKEIYICRVSLVDRGAVESIYKSCLSPEELERSSKLRFAEDRSRFVVTRGVLRCLLASYLQLSPSELAFVTNRHGKPRLANQSCDLRFNVSHSKDVAMIALSRHVELGIDVEMIRPLRDMDSIASRCLSSEQAAQFQTLAEDGTKTQAFYRFWTRKEALIKALGTGLSQPLQDFDVTFLNHHRPRLLRATSGFGSLSDWALHEINAPAGYQAALAVRGYGHKLRFGNWTLDKPHVRTSDLD